MISFSCFHGTAKNSKKLWSNIFPKSIQSEDSADDYGRWYDLGHIFHICSLSVLRNFSPTVFYMLTLISDFALY